MSIVLQGMKHMSMMRRACALTTNLVVALMAIAAFGAPQSARAEYPDKPIHVIVPFPAGGGGDTLARMVLNTVSSQQGWTLVIENRAGAGGNIGTAAAARSAPDGYTIVFGTQGTFAVNHALYKKTGFDPINDFEPISRSTQIALLLVTNPSVPAKSVKELIAYIKANPGKVNVGSAGNGTMSHLAQEIFKKETGVDYVHVPYRGGGPAKIDLVSGQIQMMIEIMPSVYPLVQQGQLNGLAVTTPKRWPLAPDIPTIAEEAVPGFAVTAWDGYWVPHGTPKETIAIWNAALHKALTDPGLRKTLLESGAEPIPSTPDELGRFLASELPLWAKVVEQSGAKVD